MTLKNRRILITGAGVRIGRALACRLADDGARIVLHCNRSLEAARELLTELGGESAGHSVVQCDLADADARDSLVSRVCRDEPLWGLINNASAYTRKPLAEVTEDDLHRDFEINAFAPIRLMCEFRNQCQSGCAINLLDQRVASVEPGAGSYALAKKTLRDATEAAALEWAPTMRVNAIAPGYVLPPPGISEQAMAPLLDEVPMQTRTHLDEIAEACRFLMMSPTLTGQILYVDGGMHLTGRPAPERTHANYVHPAKN
ncbi:MAG: SDR family oxidoreductase [Verrucomicrobiota bacterium]